MWGFLVLFFFSCFLVYAVGEVRPNLKNLFIVPNSFLEPDEALSSIQGFLGCFNLLPSFCWLKHFPNTYIELELVSQYDWC